MVCVMLNRFMEISEKWLFDRLCGIVKADDRVVVIPFAFRDSQVAGNDDWQTLYGRGGKYISGITESFAPYGILPEQFEIVNYFTDSREAAAEKINNADILYFTGSVREQ